MVFEETGRAFEMHYGMDISKAGCAADVVQVPAR